MANLQKTYIIEIQLDNARAQLDDASKKLAKLDSQLDGIGTDSKAGKAIVADMAKAAAEVDKLTKTVGTLEGKLDDLVPLAPGTVGALRLEVVQLEAAFEQGAIGSSELAATITQLADKKSLLRELSNTVNALNPRAQARAFTVFGGAVVGAFSTATVAAQVFGLSSDKAQEYQAKLQGLITVLYSVEAVSKALNGENVALIKSVIASGRAWLTAGEAASTGSKITRAALISSGVGVILVLIASLIGVVVENWDKLTGSVKGSVQFLTQFKAVASGLFDGLIAGLGLFADLSKDLFTGQFSKLASDAEGAGKRLGDAYRKGYNESIKNSNREAINLQIESYAREIELRKAQGKATLQLEIENAQRRLDNLANETKEQKKIYLDAANDLAKLKAESTKKSAEEEDAITIERLNASANLLAAKGKEAFDKQLAAKEEELLQLEAAMVRNEAAISAKKDEIDAFQATHAKELDDKARAALLARLDARASLLQAKGRDAYNQQVAREEQALAFLKSAGIRNEAEIIAQQSKIADLRATHQREQIEKAHAAELAGLDAVISLEQAKGADAFAEQVKREERQLEFLKQAGIQNLAAITAQQSKIDNLNAAHAKKEEAELRAASIARTQVELAIAQAKGEDVIALEIRIKEKELAGLLAAADRNEAAIIAKDGEVAAKRIEQEQREFDRRRALLIEQQGYELALLEQQGKDTLAVEIRQARERLALDTDTTEKGLKQKRADIAALNLLLDEQSRRSFGVGGFLLTKVFGVSDEDLPLVKARITAAYQQIADAAAFIYQSALDNVDAQLKEATDRVSAVGKELSDLQGKLASDEKALEGAQGARRDYLLNKINAERAAEERLASAKAKAAADEQRAQLKKQQLEQQGQRITAASQAATTAATASEAILAAVRAVSGANALPFPANLAAIVAALAATGAAVVSAKNLGNSFADGTGALGEDGVLEGLTHAQGGIQLFGRTGKYYGEAEDGEAITPADASTKNAAALKLIRTIGRTRVLTPADFAQIGNVQVLAPPAGHFANGTGGLGTAADVSGMVSVKASDLSVLIALTQQVVAHTQSTAGNTKAVADYGPAQLLFGPQQETQRQELEQGMNEIKAAVRL